MSALIIAPVLTRLYNSCISTGTYPRILKIGQIVPIHKGDAQGIVLQLQTHIST